MFGTLYGEDDERGGLVPDGSFLGGVDAKRGRWRDAALEAKGASPLYFWTGRGRDALEVAYGIAASKPNATTVREVWEQRHGRTAAPLLVVVAYPTEQPRRATACGPAGEDPPIFDLDHDHAERLARAALAEPDRHVAIRFLATALEGDDPHSRPQRVSSQFWPTRALPKLWCASSSTSTNPLPS